MTPSMAGRGRLAFDQYVLDPLIGTLHAGEVPIVLRPKTFDVLYCLVRHGGQLVSKEQLFAAVWPNVVVTDDSVVQCVREIRSALDDREQKAIRTIARRGYIFTRPVQALDAPSVDTLPLFSIVVLPLRNLSKHPDEEYFAEALTNDLTFDLSRIADSFVIARSTAATYKDKIVDPRQVGRELGVRYVLEGNVGRVGDRVRLDVDLVDAESGQQLWAQRFDEDAHDLVSLHEQVTGRIARTLHLNLIDVEAARRTRERPGNPTARDLTVRAFSLIERQTSETVAQARELALRALELEPERVSGWSALAGTYLVDLYARWYHLHGSREEWIRRAEDAAERAYALDPNNFYAIGARGLALQMRGKLDEAVVFIKQQIAINPNFAPAHHRLAYLQMTLGQPEEAIAEEKIVLRLSPRGNLVHNAYSVTATSLIHMGRDAEAIAAAQRAVETRPDFASAYAHLAAAAGNFGAADIARAAAAEFRRLLPHYTITTFRQENLSDRPAFLAQRERYYEGLRKAGLEQ